MRLPAILESSDFESLIIRGQGLSQINIELAHEEESEKLFHISSAKFKQSVIVNLPDLMKTINNYFEEGYSEAICLTDSEKIIYEKTPKGIRIKSEPIVVGANLNNFKADVKHLLEMPDVRKMLIELNILTKDSVIRREQHNKLIQIKNLLGIIHDILPELKNYAPLHIVDGACGKSYLSFILYHFLKNEWKFDARFQCIDTNPNLINRCRQIQDSLSYESMKFFNNSIENFKSDEKIGLLYSLHGCDTASDEVIAAGVNLNSKVIIVVPCCHFELRGQLRKHPLNTLTKFGIFEERFATLLTDSLRALALETAGYDVSVFRFVTDDISPKNTLIRAIKRNSSINPRAIEQYRELRNMFSVNPAIERLMPAIFGNR
jgi:hypothetical protein